MRALQLAMFVSTALIGCKFPELPEIVDAAPVDAREADAPIDAPPACTANTIECDDVSSVYTECSADGTVTRRFDCPLGCTPDAEKCFDIDPRNGWASYVDMVRDRSDLPSLALDGMSRIQTFDGVVFDGPSPVPVPSFDGPGNTTRIFLVEDLRISGVVSVPSGPGLVIISDGDVTIDGVLDVSADGPDSGPGAIAASPCGGSTTFGVEPTPGGGGGGRTEPGGDGGNDGGGELGGTGGSEIFDDSLEPLRGGCRGGGSANPSNNLSTGGGAGGAVHIVSRSRIVVVGQGKIDASGGGGGMGANDDNLSGGAGGGSGGGILLEAAEVILDGAGVVLSTKGGSGAAPGGGITSPGRDGGTEPGPAPGGTATGQPMGGAGGIGEVPPVNGGNGTGASNGAGGGGAAGVVQIRTRTGAINPQNGAMILSLSSVNEVGRRVVP